MLLTITHVLTIYIHIYTHPYIISQLKQVRCLDKCRVQAQLVKVRGIQREDERIWALIFALRKF